jgi:transcriptional regulator with XRE-family HTH domain
MPSPGSLGTPRRRKGSTRFGDQTGFIDALHRNRWNYKALADQLGVTYRQLYNTERGIVPPSLYLREALPAILSTPLRSLFSEAALAAQFKERHGRKDSERGGAAR